jgi:hypothetical protein
VKANSLTGSDIKDNSLKGKDVDESSLAQVPSANKADSATSAATATKATTADSATKATTATSAATATSATSAASATTAGSAATAGNADKLDNLDSTQLTLRCPQGTREKWGACLELDAHAPATPLDALNDCSARGGTLPTYLELSWVRLQNDIVWAQGTGGMQYELTGETDDSQNGHTIAIDKAGNRLETLIATTTQRYRCVLAKVNG